MIETCLHDKRFKHVLKHASNPELLISEHDLICNFVFKPVFN